ncbi:NAD(P)-dependent oxidoreductase [Streptomyces sp. M19]
MGTLMRELLPAHGYELRLLDVRPVEGAPDAITADLADRTRCGRPCGASTRSSISRASPGSPFEKILRDNIAGTQHLYEAAREEGVRRVVFASSNHVMGFHPRPVGDDPLLTLDSPRRPDTYYGVSRRSARTSPPTTGRSTASRPSPSGSAPASPNRPRCACCRSG